VSFGGYRERLDHARVKMTQVSFSWAQAVVNNGQLVIFFTERW